MKDITELLPGYNCGECGFRRCRDFASALIKNGIEVIQCPHMDHEKFSHNISEIMDILKSYKSDVLESDVIIGVIDGLKADFTLAPLEGEPSCREDLYPFDQQAKPKPGEYLRYRPLGCPVTHFARALDVEKGILTVHMTGPIHRIGSDTVSFRDIGICMVAGFDGMVSRGRIPDVGETVRFLPEHCMMQKVHSGVVVHSEGSRVRIEGIDLKVWEK
jgi:uncharacterized Fe-S cluster-containing protein